MGKTMSSDNAYFVERLLDILSELSENIGNKDYHLSIESSWHIVSLKGKKLSPIATIFKKHLSQQAKNWK